MSSHSPPATPTNPDATTSPSRTRTGIFHRESTRLRSNVADQVQRDLLPAGRMLSVFLILCELFAEVAVLIWSRGQTCDRPLRAWVQVLIIIQAGAVFLNCLNIWYGRDTFGQHRNGLSATEIDMYTDSPAVPIQTASGRSSSPQRSSDPRSSSSASHLSSHVVSTPSYSSPSQSSFPSSTTAPHSSVDSNTGVIVDVTSTTTNSRDYSFSHTFDVHDSRLFDDPDSEEVEFQSDTRPLISHGLDPHQSPHSATNSQRPNVSSHVISNSDDVLAHRIPRSPAAPAPHSSIGQSTRSATVLANESESVRMSPSQPPSAPSGGAYIPTEFVDRYVRIVNAWYLVWYILGSIWVSDGGTCSSTAPHLYRLIVALTIIYYALLFLPLACFCLIVCCLPLFILVYRIMLPYAERERRRARAADPAQVQSLNSIPYSLETFRSYTGSDNLDDASCVICLCDYEPDEVVRFLPCKHHFHRDCVDVWLRLDKACCLCKQDIDAQAAPSQISAV